MSVTAVPIRPLKKGSLVKFWLGLALLALAAAGMAWFATAAFRSVTTASGVGLQTIKAGTGAKITPADVAALHYKLHIGSKEAPVFQDSRQTGQPFVTTTQGIYPGFAEGLQLMRSGGSYVLTLPGGTHEQGPMPPEAPFKPTDKLVFEIDVLQVMPGEAQRFIQMQQMQQLERMQQMQQMQNGGGQGEAPPAGPPPAR